jgi:hypothetical protein
MRKLFFVVILWAFHFSFCNAQDKDIDTIACRNGRIILGKVTSIGKEKVTYLLLPDSTELQISNWRVDYIAYPGGTKFNFTEKEKPAVPSTTDLFLSADGGASVPAISYRDGIVGFHFGARATYYFNHHFGIVAKADADFNGTGLDYIASSYWGGFYIFQQYLAGVTYRTGGKPGFPFVDFVGLAGICNATNPVSEQGGGVDPLTINTPGKGSGVGYYLGIDFTSSSDRFASVTFGAGCVGASFSYPNFTSTVAKYDPSTSLTHNITSDGVSQMSLALFQMYVSVNFHVKKAAR